MYKLTFLLSIIAIAMALETTPAKHCKNISPDMNKKVVVKTTAGVCTKPPCLIKRGSSVQLNVTFDVKSRVEKIVMKMNVTSNKGIHNYPIQHAKDGCKFITNTACPIEPNTEANLEIAIPVQNSSSKAISEAIFYLLDQHNKPISCFEVPVKVV